MSPARCESSLVLFGNSPGMRPGTPATARAARAGTARSLHFCVRRASPASLGYGRSVPPVFHESCPGGGVSLPLDSASKPSGNLDFQARRARAPSLGYGGTVLPDFKEAWTGGGVSLRLDAAMFDKCTERPGKSLGDSLRVARERVPQPSRAQVATDIC